MIAGLFVRIDGQVFNKFSQLRGSLGFSGRSQADSAKAAAFGAYASAFQSFFTLDHVSAAIAARASHCSLTAFLIL